MAVVPVLAVGARPRAGLRHRLCRRFEFELAAVGVQLPAVVVDEVVTALAQQGQVVDVGKSAPAEPLDVVGLTSLGGCGAVHAAAVAGRECDALTGAGVESVSAAFNSPFWPFVLASTSIGQEGLDFHLWCHAAVYWNLPYNPVDLEQREGRVHRYKGHAIRRNIAATLGPDLLGGGLAPGADPWDELFALAMTRRRGHDSEMVPYWVFHEGPAKIERHVPVMPFSREQAALPRLRKALAAYRLAFGQPRQEELVEFLGENLSDKELGRLRIDLSPPEQPDSADFCAHSRHFSAIFDDVLSRKRNTLG